MNQKHIRAILIDVVDPAVPKEDSDKRLVELENLVNTYGGIVVVKAIQKRGVPDYETYIGKGKVEEIAEIARAERADILVINNLLKPRQLFNLNEKFRKDKVKLKAWDRVDLILKIFDKHAKSTKAKLQIELASIRHMGPRIFGMGIELSRQAGALGLRGGAGEANTEVMRRHLRAQELNIMKKLEHYDKIDEGHRKRRRRQNFKTVALVGYTNAGKSSLLNALTNKGAYVANELFATLDTRVGKLYIPPDNPEDPEGRGREILISDTIGFIQDLPPTLIDAFKSTLAETVEADLILHVIDIADEDFDKKIECVEEILTQLGLEDKTKIYAFNKVDLIGPKSLFTKENPQLKRPSLVKAGENAVELLGWIDHSQKIRARATINALKKHYKKFRPVFTSAESRTNFDELIELIKSLV